MEVVRLTRAPSTAFIDTVARQNDVDRKYFADRPPEDYLLASDLMPIFSVADGVSLRTGPNQPYPNPSGAAEAARLFCQNVVTEAELKYESLDTDDLPKLFRTANEAISTFNATQGLNQDSINYWDRDLYSTTGAFAIVRDRQLFWGTICDSYVILYKQSGEIKFRSPSCLEFNVIKFPGWAELDKKQRHLARHRLARNVLNDQNQPIGYGVADGEANAERYFRYGSTGIETGDILLVITDGFENYLELAEFSAIFKGWPTNLETDLTKLVEQCSRQDPLKFGREATLIAVRNF